MFDPFLCFNCIWFLAIYYGHSLCILGYNEVIQYSFRSFLLPSSFHSRFFLCFTFELLFSFLLDQQNSTKLVFNLFNTYLNYLRKNINFVFINEIHFKPHWLMRKLGLYTQDVTTMFFFCSLGLITRIMIELGVRGT